VRDHDRVAETELYAASPGKLPYDPDRDRVQCHLCGRWLRFIGGTHLTRTHGWTLAEYRDAFRLPSTLPTCSRSLSDTRREQTRQRIADGDLPARGALVDGAFREYVRSQRQLASWRSLAANHPELVHEMHPTRNPGLDPKTIGAGSTRKVWWRCSEGHEWQARIADRSTGRGCPVCANARRGKLLGEVNQRVNRERTLAVRRPELLAELHPTRNPGLERGSLAAGSARRVWWQCPRGHEWQTRVYNRVAGTGCPKCASEQRADALRGRPGRVPPARSLAARYPELVGELHPTRNPGVDPHAVGAGSATQLWWRCPRGHQWQARVNDRGHGRGCPVCARERPVPRERSLAVRHPELVTQLHPTHNQGVDPLKVAAGSNRKLWWRCRQGHEWNAAVAARARGTGCPTCARRQVRASRSLARVRPEVAAELHPTRNGQLDPTTLGAWSNRKVWWRCSEGHEWPAVTASRSGGAGCPHCYQRRRAATA
jgi:hypothetical protein